MTRTDPQNGRTNTLCRSARDLKMIRGPLVFGYLFVDISNTFPI